MASFYPKQTEGGGSPLDVNRRVAASLRSGAHRQETFTRRANNPPTPSQLLHRSLVAKENSSEDVLRIAEEKLSELDANSCATAIHKVAQLCRRRSAASVGRDVRLQHLLDHAVENTGAWTSRQLCHIAWSFAALTIGGSGRRQLLDRVCDAFSEKLWEGVPQDLSTFAWSLAALLVQNPAFDVTMRASMERLSEFGVQDLAISAWSLAKLLHADRRPLLTAIAKESQLKLKEFGGRNLSSMSWDVLLILWIYFGDVAKVWAKWRAQHAPRRSIKAEAPLLKDDGTLEESAVALLLDSLTGFSLWTSGTIGFVTAELSFQMKGLKVKKGDELFIKAWVQQPPRMPEDKRLREFAKLAFQLFLRGNDAQDPYDEEYLVAEGEQLMVSIATMIQKIHWKLQLLCPPFFERSWQGGMKTLASYAKHALPIEEVRSLKHLAALTGPPGGTFFAKLQTRQLNVNGVGHGAATASLLCIATSELLNQSVSEAKFFYLSPAPPMTPLLLEIKPSKTPGHVQVFMRKEKGSAPMIRGTITLAPRAIVPMPRHVLPGLRNVIPQISKLHKRFETDKNESPNDSDSNAASDGSSSGRPVISRSGKSVDERSSGDDDVEGVDGDVVDDDENKEGDAKHHEDHDGNCDHDVCRAHDQNGASGL
eukprot:symbB.v1.2.002277.t1/scaffold100.1/size330964/1